MSDFSKEHRIHVVLDGRDYGTRRWVNVPRVGDRVMLRRERSDEFFFVKVTSVTWGVAVDDMDSRWPDINLGVTEE